MLAVSVVIFAAACAIYLRQPNASVFHPATFYLAFHGLVFVIRPIFAWHYRYDNIYGFIGFRPSLWERTQVLICTNLGLVAFMAVVLWMTRERFAFPAADPRNDGREALLRRFWIVAVPLAALAAWSLYWRWDAIAGAVGFSQMDPRTGEQRLVGVTGYFYEAARISAPVGAMLAYLGRFRWWTAAPVTALAVLQIGTGGRGDFVAMAVMIALLFMYDRRLKWPSVWVMAAALAVLPVFHFVKSDRGAFLREALRPGVTDLAPDRRFDDAPLETMDIAHMEFFEYLVWAIPKRTGTYDYFANNLELVTAPIPRAVWPDKPIGAPVKRFELYENTRPIAITHSLPGMGWYNAGYAGVVLWCALFAAIYGAGFRAFARSGRGPLAAMAYVAFLATATIAFRDGMLQTLARQLVPYGLPILALSLLVRFGPREDPDVQAG